MRDVGYGRGFGLMRVPLVQRIARSGLIGLLAIAPFTACSSAGEEGDACDRDNGNEDCENGLVCRGDWEVQADEAVCCPRPPAKPSTEACKPELEHHVPDPSIDASFGAGGTGTGGNGGSAGSAGTAGSGGASDAATDGTLDASSDASTGGSAGSAGAGGSSGNGGKGGNKPDSGGP